MSHDERAEGHGCTGFGCGACEEEYQRRAVAAGARMAVEQLAIAHTKIKQLETALRDACMEHEDNCQCSGCKLAFDQSNVPLDEGDLCRKRDPLNDWFQSPFGHEDNGNEEYIKQESPPKWCQKCGGSGRVGSPHPGLWPIRCRTCLGTGLEAKP